jgi:hypothetical protein
MDRLITAKEEKGQRAKSQGCYGTDGNIANSEPAGSPRLAQAGFFRNPRILATNRASEALRRGVVDFGDLTAMNATVFHLFTH